MQLPMFITSLVVFLGCDIDFVTGALSRNSFRSSVVTSAIANDSGHIVSQVPRNQTAFNNTASCVPPGMRQVSVLNGAFNMVVLGPNDIVSQDIATVGYWEIRDPQEIASVAGRTLPPKGTFLDVGANIGYYSLLFARRGYQVIAVEPMTTNRKALEASLCLNPDLRQFITIVPSALGSLKETKMRCRVTSTNSQINVGNGFMVCGKEGEVAPCAPGDPLCEMVLVKTLDSVLKEHYLAKVDVVKMDIESHECEVLSGGQSMFQPTYPQILKMETTVADSTACVRDEAIKHRYQTYAMGGDTIMAKI